MADVKLPVDATGKEIPLDTKVLYREDGTAFDVYSWRYFVEGGFWAAVERADLDVVCGDCLYLDPPDSWEKLLEDLDRGSSKELSCCEYFGYPATVSCNGCPAQGKGCTRTTLSDTSARIRKLMGAER